MFNADKNIKASDIMSDLDKFIDGLPESDMVKLRDFRAQLYKKLHDITLQEISTWCKVTRIDAIYLVTAAAMASTEVAMTQATALNRFNVAAGSSLRRSLKKKVAAW